MITVLGKVFDRHPTGFYYANIGSIGTFVYELGKDRWRIVVFRSLRSPMNGMIDRCELGRVTITGLYNALKQAVEQMKREVEYVSGNR